MQKRCVILAGGEINPADVSVPDDAFVICADRGYAAAEKLGINPVLVMGDFDSLGFVPSSDCTRTYPPEKDDTDTMLAVKAALEKGAEEIFIYGALGGRLDHTFANIQTLQFIANHGARGILIGGNDMFTMQTGPSCVRYERHEGYYFSVFSYSEKCTGVNITGTEYTLTEGVLANDFPLGVSNHITEEYAEISLQNGVLVIIESKEA